MSAADTLCAALPNLLDTAARNLPGLLLRGLGIVREDERNRSLLAYVDVFGTSYLPRTADLPEPFRPREGDPYWGTPADFSGNPAGLVQSRLSHTGIEETIRDTHRLRRVLTFPMLRRGCPPAILIAGFGNEQIPDLCLLEPLQAAADQISHLLDRTESRDEELERLRRLEAVEQLLPAFFNVLDIREIFERLSTIAGGVVPHDFASIGVFNDDYTEMSLFAGTAAMGNQQYSGPMPYPPSQTSTWICRYVPDVHKHPLDSVSDIAGKGGAHGSIRVAVRLGDRTIAAANFSARAVDCYTALDLTIARRFADYLALGISHQRAAEEGRRAAVLEERNANLELKVRTLTEELDARTGARRVAGDSREWKQVLQDATKVAATDTTVLLLGESGTGKEVVARYLHRASGRSAGPFVAMNCAALPENLLEAELFGYERGAYTGASQSKAGHLEVASGGTLFLDEVGEMSLPAQAKILRVLQEREFQRLGGTRVLHTEVRIVAATNRDLERAIAHGQFREDLYYRLNVFAIRLPALRDRRDDILPLTEAFLEEFSQRFGRPPSGISREARQVLIEHSWPGNVRELHNSLERAAILCEGGLITPEHLPPLKTGGRVPAGPAQETSSPALVTPAAEAAPGGDISSVERAMIEQALRNARFNKSRAAKALGLTRQQLYGRMRRYGLE